jgi:hypothetical protein
MTADPDEMLQSNVHVQIFRTILQSEVNKKRAAVSIFPPVDRLK